MNAKLEKVARMMGKTTYKDFRQGFSTRSLAQDSDADIKAALGMAQRAIGDRGALAVQVLETRCASTLVHERALRRAWDRHCKQAAEALGRQRGRNEQHEIAIERLGAALAIRYLAGAKTAKPDIDEWAWVLRTSQYNVDKAVRDCGAWLDELCWEAEREFLRAIESRDKAA